jgi:1,4-dihydroxy-2-naphthoate octaprenyltransferase
MNFKELTKPISIFRVLSVIMTYALGVGLVQYVESIRSWSTFIQGGVFILLIVLALDYLGALGKSFNRRTWPESATFREIKQVRLALGLISATFMTVATTLFINWMVSGFVWQGLIVLLIAVILIGGLYYFSQISERLRPYSILFEALLVVVIPPALGYFIQSASLHQLLTLVILGLVPIYMAYSLLTHLIHYGQEEKYKVKTVATTLGWEKTMVLHNALILMGYVLMALTALLGFPWFLLWPVFLTFPIALLEIWLMERVRRGRKPLWRIMQFATASVFFIPVYLLGFAFWIR